MANKYSKGSDWRKWDLHIHGPADVLQNQFKGNTTAEKWGNYLDAIEKTDIEVLGFTNYFCLNGYEEIIAHKKENRISNVKLILPNIEFRMSQPNKKNEFINIHVIFSDQINIKQIKDFLGRLKLFGTSTDGKQLYCSENDLKRVGYDKALVELNTLKDQLNKDFEPLRDFIIVGVPHGYGSFRPNGGEGRGITVATEIDKNAHAFFGRADNINYFLDAKRYKDAVPKPVIVASDAHQLDSINGNFSWIKADPTFEGLKQIIFEPQERIKLQEEKPEGKKTYFVIDKVRFIDNSKSPSFPGDFIEINQNLATVIGGRSTGKSLLMYYIVKTIDKDELSNRIQEGLYADEIYNFDENPNFNFEVVWGDGKISRLRTSADNGDSEENRKILYIPQNYLNRLSEVDIKGRDTLNQFVIRVLVQDENAKRSYTEALDHVNRLDKEIPAILNDLFSVKTEIEQLQEDLKKIGNPDGIVSYIKKLEKEAAIIKNKSGLSETEIKRYESLSENEKTVNTELTNLSADRDTIINLQRDLLSHAKNILSTKEEHAGYLNDKDVIKKLDQAFTRFEKMESDIKELSQTIINEIDKKINRSKTELAKIKKELTPLTSKVKLQTDLEKKAALIKGERGKLDKIALRQKTLQLKSTSFSKKRGDVINLYKTMFSKYEELRNEFKKYESKFEDISLSIVVGFREQEFNTRVVDEFLNKWTLKKVTDVGGNEEYRYYYDSTKHLEEITKIFNGILDGKVGILKHRSGLDAITKLLENRFFLDFGIAYKDDPLDKMSPGKKGLVLLKLLIELSNDEWPILLDQPDDDLDNRSIYTDLVSFLQKKKVSRQIVIATHNPNLVVGADAEEVIVANQAGQEAGRDNRKFRFEYVSGALENSFELNEKQEKAILYRKGVRQHVCEILEGGKEAFQKREQKYSFPK